MWRKKLHWLLLYLALAPLAVAQFTTVTGTVTDPNGLPYAFGTIAPSIVASGTPTFTASGQVYLQPSQASGLDGSGRFTVTLANNTLLSPGGSTWTFTVCSGQGTVQPSFGKGPQCFTVTGVSISGSSQDIGATLRAAAPALTVNFAGGGTITGAGNANTIPLWTTSSNLGNSDITLSGGIYTVGANRGWTVTGNLGVTNGKINSYSGDSTSGNGVSTTVGITSQSGAKQTNLASTNMYTMAGNTTGGPIRIDCYTVITQAATTSSTLPSCQVLWTDLSTSVAETLTFGSTLNGTTNTIGSYITGSVVVWPAVGTTVQIATTGYASSGGTPMQYGYLFYAEKP